MNLSKRLRQARTQLGYTQKQLAKEVGCSQQSINSIERGESVLPRKLAQIAACLNITPEWLQYGVKTESHLHTTIPASSGAHLIPILDWPSVGKWRDSIENLTNDIGQVYISNKFNKECFILQVTDNSMINSTIGEQTFLPGSTILVDPSQKQPKHNDYIVASLSSKAGLFRQFINKNGRYYLHALNNQINDIKFIKKNITIIGTVVQTSMDL